MVSDSVSCAGWLVCLAVLWRLLMPRCSGWCLLCYAGVRGREGFPGHAGHHRKKPIRRLRCAMGMLKRPVVREPGGLPDLQKPSELGRSYPALLAFLSEATWDDGSARETGTAMLLTGDGLLKLWLHDRNGEGSAAWAAGETLEDVLAAADDMIATGSGEWRKDRNKTSAGSRRRS